MLRWDYYQYAKEHPIEKWAIPTSILYGEKDNMQSKDIIQIFVQTHDCELVISPNSEHSFLKNED